MWSDPFAFAVAVVAVIILGLAKGGFAGVGVIAVPLMALVMPPVTAASILLPILIVQDVVSVWSFRKTWHKALLLHLIPGAALGVIAGYALAAYVPRAAVALAVGLISIVFGVLRLRVEFAAKRATPPALPVSTPLLGVAAGAASGFTSQISHAGGPPFQMYVLPKGLPRDVFIGTSAIFFAAVNWMKVPAYFALGQLTPKSLSAGAALLPVALLSTWGGVWLVRRVPGEAFYRIIYGLLIIVGLKLSADGLGGLIGRA